MDESRYTLPTYHFVLYRPVVKPTIDNIHCLSTTLCFTGQLWNPPNPPSTRTTAYLSLCALQASCETHHQHHPLPTYHFVLYRPIVKPTKPTIDTNHCLPTTLCFTGQLWNPPNPPSTPTIAYLPLCALQASCETHHPLQPLPIYHSHTTAKLNCFISSKQSSSFQTPSTPSSVSLLLTSTDFLNTIKNHYYHAFYSFLNIYGSNHHLTQ